MNRLSKKQVQCGIIIHQGERIIMEKSRKILKRNGEVQLFDDRRIYVAIEKAFQSEAINDPKSVQDVLDHSLDMLTILENDRQAILTVEETQDIVEQALMLQGHHKIARNYILYRERHALARQEKVVEQVQNQTLTVKVSDQEETLFNPQHIEEYLRRLATGLYKVSVSDIITAVTKQIYNGIPQKELDTLILGAVRERIELHYEYSLLSSRIQLDRLYMDTIEVGLESAQLDRAYKTGFAAYIKQGIALELLHPELATFNLETLSEALTVKNDLLFHYLGIQILSDRYFIKNREMDAKTIELPQWFWMRVAMGLALKEPVAEREERTISFYQVLSNMDLVSSTPTLFNSGTLFSQMSSCYLNITEDSLEGIFKLYADNAKLSKWAGGIGTDWTPIRATGSKIKGTNGTSQGIIPFIKIFNDVALAVNQGGKRKGAMVAYLEMWHLDIDQFFELRKNTGDERRRTHDINTACWIPDLFMKRMENNEQWTLFCPADTPKLHESYGAAFEAAYTAYEQDPKIRKKQVPALDLWRKLLTMLFETGHPWVTFKDPCNIRSPQDHAGVVHSSNLCTEITLNTSKTETAVCNLASINMAHMLTPAGQLDEEKIKQTVRVGIRMLDNVIDNNYYPTKEAETANLAHRAIGLGMMGYQDALYQQNIAFESEENIEFADVSMEMISYYAILASAELAKEKGAYSSYKGSKWDRGIFPLDTLDLLEKERGQTVEIDRHARLDWDTLKEFVAKNGMRNSNVMAIAPTATIANISGVYPCTEPAYKNMYMKENLSGNFIVMNQYLMDDLEALGLWNSDAIKQLKLGNGSVQNIIGLPTSYKEKYKETFEIDAHWVLTAAAKRSKWIDQAASTNVFLSTQSGSILSSTYMKAWRLGLKTTYYLRTLAATQVKKMTVQDDSVFTPQEKAVAPAVNACSILDPECEACQ